MVATVAVLIIPVSLQIFSRFTALIPSYIWTEEMARFLFIWSIMFGAMLGVREGTHFEVDIFMENFLQLIACTEMTHKFDGHANCFIETGDGKAMLIDFNYDTEPLPGKFPYGGLGPMGLLKEGRLNHVGKLGFRWVYWNMLMPGRPLPIPSLMSTSGKRTDLITAK